MLMAAYVCKPLILKLPCLFKTGSACRQSGSTRNRSTGFFVSNMSNYIEENIRSSFPNQLIHFDALERLGLRSAWLSMVVYCACVRKNILYI